MSKLFKTWTNMLTSPNLYQYERGMPSQLKACVKKLISWEEKKIICF